MPILSDLIVYCKHNVEKEGDGFAEVSVMGMVCATVLEQSVVVKL